MTAGVQDRALRGLGGEDKGGSPEPHSQKFPIKKLGFTVKCWTCTCLPPSSGSPEGLQLGHRVSYQGHSAEEEESGPQDPPATEVTVVSLETCVSQTGTHPLPGQNLLGPLKGHRAKVPEYGWARNGLQDSCR
jgi:hypothetical protein